MPELTQTLIPATILPAEILTPGAALPASAAGACVNPLELLLADKRSAATRRAYRADLIDFFQGEPKPSQVAAFAGLPEGEIAARLGAYKARLIQAGLAEATVNRRLSAVRSLLKLCHRLGYAKTDGRGLVDGEKVTAYRDTRGISLAQLRRLVELPGRESVAGLRDTAILRLLCENALRRAELCSLDVADFSLPERRCLIRGKGRGTQKEPVTLAAGTAQAVAAYLIASRHTDGALFRNLDRRTKGGRLTPKAVWDLVRAYGARIGEAGLAPHKLRHSAITAALDATGGDVRKVRKLSRHKKLDTLLIYDDARHDMQGEVTRQLSALLGGE